MVDYLEDRVVRLQKTVEAHDKILGSLEPGAERDRNTDARLEGIAKHLQAIGADKLQDDAVLKQQFRNVWEALAPWYVRAWRALKGLFR